MIIVYSDVFVENKKLPNAVLNFRIHPNPTADILNISFVHPSKEMLGVTILDLNGQTLLHKAKIDPNVTLVMPITDLPTGVYIVQIHSKSGIGIQKLVIH